MEPQRGKFSSYFDRPSWQKATIDNYIEKEVSNETCTYYGQYTNWRGRATPDISAHSPDPRFQVVMGAR